MHRVMISLAAVATCVAVRTAGAQSFMVTGNGSSANQEHSADALDQADQQAKDNATASCVSLLTGEKGNVENLRINFHAAFRQKNDLFGATSQAIGTCKIGGSTFGVRADDRSAPQHDDPTRYLSSRQLRVAR